MLPLCELSAFWQISILILIFVSACIRISAAIAAYLWMRLRKEILCLAAMFCLDFQLLFLLRQQSFTALSRAERIALQLPAAVYLLYLLAAAGLTALLIRRLWHTYHHTITASSIRESFDRLPSGLCFCTEDGLPLLVNQKMNEIAWLVTGSTVQNGQEFWHAVSRSSRRLSQAQMPVLSLSDGRVYSFARSCLRLDQRQVIQLSAADVTDLYQLSRQLADENRELDAMNQRLRAYSADSETLQKEEELLAARIRIHDELGNALTVTRYRLQQGNSSEWNDLFELWRQCILLLRNETAARLPAGGFSQLQDAAKAADVTIQLTGTFPEQNPVIERVLLNAGRECLTNAVRHADAHTLFIRIAVLNGWIQAEFTNDGRAPDKEIQEGGGLSAIRRRVESIGGSMHTVSAGPFMLILRVPERSRTI